MFYHSLIYGKWHLKLRYLVHLDTCARHQMLESYIVLVSKKHSHAIVASSTIHALTTEQQ